MENKDSKYGIIVEQGYPMEMGFTPINEKKSEDKSEDNNNNKTSDTCTCTE